MGCVEIVQPGGCNSVRIGKGGAGGWRRLHVPVAGREEWEYPIITRTKRGVIMEPEINEVIKQEKMVGVREYSEGLDPRLLTVVTNECTSFEGETRLVIEAVNEGGYNSTAIDLFDALRWIKDNRDDLIEGIVDVFKE